MKYVHFVCRGNVYRSRLAEAYASSLLDKKDSIIVSSSGVEANLALNGDVDPEAVRLLKDDNLLHHLAPTWHHTSQEDIDKNDLLVFMSKSVYKQANDQFKIPAEKVRIWDIPDIDGIYPIIKKNVEELLRAEF
jgi:protein-tyrosine-phosphatase